MSALAEFAELKRLPIDFLKKHGLKDLEDGAIGIPYGESGRGRIRKNPQSAHPSYWVRGDSRPIRSYGHNLVEKMKNGSNQTLVIAEGESDALSLWYHRRPAIGIPGATMSQVIQTDDVTWASTAVIVREPGDAGAKFVAGVAKRLRERGFTGSILQMSLEPHKDASALHIAVNGDRPTFSASFDAAIAKAAPVPLAVDTHTPSEPTVLSAADLLNSPDEQIDYLVDGLLPKGGIMLLVGKPKCGKSVLARNFALATCRGVPFLGRATEKSPVLWLALEESKAQVSSAFRAMGLRAEDGIHFFFGHVAKDAQEWLEQTCQRVGAGLVVIDTWHKLTLIENVNDYAAVNRANQRLQQLAREKGVAQVWTHHANKGIARNGSEVLGSQALFAAVDTLMSMDRAEDGTRTIWTIQRSGDDLEPTVVTMSDDEQIAATGTRREVEIERAQSRLLEALGTEPMTTKDLRDAVGIRATMFWSALNALVRSGRVDKSGEGISSNPFRYSLGHQSLSLGNHSPLSTKTSSHSFKTIKELAELGSHDSGTTWEPPGTTGTSGTTGTTQTDHSERGEVFANE